MEQMTFWKNTESVSKEIMELLKTIRGDITKITDVQAIVNAANNSLFATYLIEEGVDISCVQRILGHSSIKTTQIYIHVAARKQAEILRDMHPRNNMKIIGAA